MACLILNGSPTRSSLDDYLARFAGELERHGQQVKRVDLRDLKLRTCVGCWSCWWKTPGLCALHDDMGSLYPEMTKADLVVWASPLIVGAVSALLKTAQDRFIPVMHPYIELVDGECHHRYRYAHNADVGVIVEPTADDTVEDVALTRLLYERFTRNTRTRLRLFATPCTPVEEAAHEALAC